MISFDSNILIYAINRDAGARHGLATDLIERGIRSGKCLQSLQTLAEFFNVTTRKFRMPPTQAAMFVEGWRAVTQVEAATADDLAAAMHAVALHGLSFWDAMLWATVRRAGVRMLISEDLQDGRVLEGVRIVNPFAAHNAALLDRMLPARA